MLDLVVLDIRHLVLDNRAVIASLILYILLNQLQMFPTENYTDSLVLLNYINPDNHKDQTIEKEFFELYKDFLFQSFNYLYEDITESLDYTSQYNKFLGKVVLDLPLAIQMAPEDDVEINNVSKHLFYLYRATTKTSFHTKLITKRTSRL